MTFKSIATAAMLVVASIMGVTVATTGAAAEGGDTLLGGVLETAENASKYSPSTLYAAAGGYQDRAVWWAGQNAVPNFVVGLVPSLDRQQSLASQEAESLTTYFNEHNATYVTYVNSRENWTTNYTAELEIHQNGETATRYILVNATDADEVVEMRMVNNTSRVPDYNPEVCGYLANQATEELRYFTENFAEPDKDPSNEYLARMKGRYGGDAETALFPTSGECDA